MPSAGDIGTLYQAKYNNINWSQPGGKGTQVFPAQADGQPFSAYPVPGQIFVEAGEALWRAGCGHGFDAFRIQQDYDPTTKSSCALILCPICSYLINVIEPYELVYSVTQHPIIVG